ncbi:cupin domain-containing protein [Lysobacter niastensis]|uniref:Cupin domain-containing protein n=1 Tax=Lysobacter niastensis TaxID=380629 RepID=A0ABS0BA98_9GAMM|nr:cupin domain-containing protein [Lysobacter niastensis]MBF6025914.1 cupin domain-containing protein [Lysobacter niastensis]
MSSPISLAVAALLLLASSDALAQKAADEPALALAFTDAQLKWLGCPSFMPAGCEIAVLHGDPAKANADILIRVPADSTIPHHWHTSAERMVLLSGQLQVTYDGQETVALWPGHYAYGPAKRPHHAYCSKGSACVLFIAFESPVDAVPSASPGK